MFLRGRLTILDDSPLCQRLLYDFHSTAVGGHARTACTYQRLTSNFFWKQMRRDVQTYVASCLVFQQKKSSHQFPASLLQLLPILELVFEDISMDFIICLPSSKGISTIMTIVDCLSKYDHFIPSRQLLPLILLQKLS